MKNLIRRILKESIEEFDWVSDTIKQFTPAEEFLYDLMSNLTIIESKKMKNWVVYKNEMGKILMTDNINTGDKKPILYVDYDEIWSKLRDNYGLGYKEAMALCVRMLEMTHKRKVLTAINDWENWWMLLEMTHKRKVLTAFPPLVWPKQRWR